MKKILLFIGLTLLIFSCKKEKFDLGVYQVFVNGCFKDDSGNKHDYNNENSFVTITSESKDEVVIKNPEINSSTYQGSVLEKKGLKITGFLPGGVSSPDGFYIKGSRNVFNSNISGKFETSLGTSVDGYFHYVPMTGKFKMVKQ